MKAKNCSKTRFFKPEGPSSLKNAISSRKIDFVKKILKCPYGVWGLPKDVLGCGGCLGMHLEALEAIWSNLKTIEKKSWKCIFSAVFTAYVENGMVLSPDERHVALEDRIDML